MAKLLARVLRRALVIVVWFFKNLTVAAQDKPDKTRLLMIYDFGSQPISIGDILVFQAAGAVLRRSYAVNQMDVALVYDRDQPVIRDVAFSHINRDNFTDHLSEIASVAGMDPSIGSLLIFDSHSALERYVDNNISRYFLWPSLTNYAAKGYLYYQIFNEVLFNFHEKFGDLPEITIPSSMLKWANEFICQHVGTHSVISVQLRRNSRDPRRNSDYEEWLKFFDEIQSRYSVKFIVIGAVSEIDPRFENVPGLLIAKRYGTSLKQDLALIRACRFHMGASSGPSTIALFSNKPYCIFNTDVRSDLLKGTFVEGRRNRFFFASPVQTMISGNETNQLLVAEFERMWEASKCIESKS